MRNVTEKIGNIVIGLTFALSLCFAWTIMLWFCCNIGDFYEETCPKTISGTVKSEVKFIGQLARNFR